ncbi:MAG: energy-coupling factor transporter ATPase [Oscillospiraceae bacterium]|jgi:energy-coupling factor transport system ATP-binding protein|nr:energy-coupling factor transporter ATPase [Oscillospiraceae bacterium]
MDKGGEALLKTEKLTHIYGKGTPFERTAIKDVDFEVHSGEIMGVIGHTGSGKSTLAQHLNALLKPASGRVLLNGEDIWRGEKKVSSVRFAVGLVFQYPEYQLFEETVYKDIAFGVKNSGVPEKDIESAVYSAMDFVHLDKSVAAKSPFELSGGQKRRVAIAGVIAMMPKVLVLDEPTAGLDPKGRREILSHIRAYRDATGASVVLITHSMDEIARLSDRVTVINRGEIALGGSVREVFSREDSLTRIGLRAPVVSRVLRRLHAMGIDVDCGACTVEQAIAELKRVAGDARA